jgi:hypothetical protein
MSYWFLVSYVLLWVLVGICFLGVFALYHHFGQMYVSTPEARATQGPAEGALIKATETVSLSGKPLILPKTTPTLVIFASTTCSACTSLRGATGQLAAAEPGLSVVVICEGKRHMVQEWATGMSDLVQVVADPQNKIGDRYDVDLVPFCVAVDAEGHVRAKGLVNDYSDLSALAAKAVLPADDTTLVPVIAPTISTRNLED